MTTLLPLKAVASYNDEVLSESFDPEAQIRYIEIGDVSETDGVTGCTELAFGNAPSRARRVVRAGDVLVSTVRTYLRAVAAVEKTDDGAIASTGFAVLRARSVEPRFLRYAVLERRFMDEVEARSTGISYPAINASDLVGIKIRVPVLAEQRAIADFLDRETAQIDAFIAKNDELITLLTERRAAVIMHATRSLVGDALGEKLGYTCQLGNGSTPRREDARYWDRGDFPWLNSSVVNLDRVDEAAEFVTAIAQSECHLPRIHPGAIVVGLTGEGRTRGMATMVNIEATINQHLAYIQPNERVWHPAYLLWLMHSLYRELRDLSDANGSTKGGLTVSQLRGLRVVRPPLGEQLRVSAALDTETARIAQAVNTARRGIDLARERRAALISAAVTGKIDVGVGA